MCPVICSAAANPTRLRMECERAGPAPSQRLAPRRTSRHFGLLIREVIGARFVSLAFRQRGGFVAPSRLSVDYRTSGPVAFDGAAVCCDQRYSQPICVSSLRGAEL